MPSEGRLTFLKKMIILGPKTAILGPQFCRILVLGPHFWWSGGPGPLGTPPGSAPEEGAYMMYIEVCSIYLEDREILHVVKLLVKCIKVIHVRIVFKK